MPASATFAAEEASRRDIEKLMMTYADLQDGFVQVANLLGSGPPQELERLMLLEELASVELPNGFEQLGRRRRGARRDEVSPFESLQGASELGVG